MVFASRPVASDNRFAALPVGAQRRHFTPLARRILRIEFSVVLPTPGPPVMITTRLVSAVRRAFPLAGSQPLARLRLAPLHRLVEINGWYAGCAPANARIFAAILSSACCRVLRRGAERPNK
jgi:hypothetical protein